jgi:hypothetical protein
MCAISSWRSGAVIVDASGAATTVFGSGLRPFSRRQPGQPFSGASDGISDPHFGQTLGALIIAGESLTRSLCFLLRKMLSEVTPGLQQLNLEAHPHLPFGALWYTGNKAGNVIDTHEEAGDFKGWWLFSNRAAVLRKSAKSKGFHWLFFRNRICLHVRNF